MGDLAVKPAGGASQTATSKPVTKPVRAAAAKKKVIQLDSDSQEEDSASDFNAERCKSSQPSPSTAPTRSLKSANPVSQKGQPGPSIGPT
jgi:hypothetical protein